MAKTIESQYNNHREEILKAERIIICACGTSWHAGLIGKYIIEELARIPVEVEYSSEFRYRNPIITNKDIVIAISQSGETADTLAALKEAKRRGAKTIAIVNVVSSAIATTADDVIYTWAGPEIAVATTKAYTAQITVCMLLAIKLARVKSSINEGAYSKLISEIKKIPDKIKGIRKQSSVGLWEAV